MLAYLRLAPAALTIVMLHTTFDYQWVAASLAGNCLGDVKSLLVRGGRVVFYCSFSGC